MLPMVADQGELGAARALLGRLADDAGIAPPALGIMVETPAAALTAARLAEDAALFSLGRHCLLQYTQARDTSHPTVPPQIERHHSEVSSRASRERWVQDLEVSDCARAL